VTIGESLASARAAAGLSLEQVAERTRIRRTVVAAIEHDDFSHCGGDFYARGHLRTIARTVGADSDAIVAQYDDEIASAESAPRPPSEVVDLDAANGRTHRGLNWSNVLVASLVLVVAYAAFSVLRPGDDGGGSPTGNAAPVGVSGLPSPGATPTPATAPSAAPTRKPAGAIASNPDAGVRVVVAATDGQCWLRATGAGGKRLFEGIVAKGASRQFTDSEVVNLLVGDAGAVSLTVNGKQIGAPGARGEIARAEFTPEDP